MFQDALARLKCLVVDEIFNLPQRELANIDTVLKVATSKPELPFGGIHFLGPGDGYQLPPVLATSIFSSTKIGQRGNEKAERGFDLYRQFTCFKELFFNWRQRKSNASVSDAEFVNVLGRCRIGKTTSQDITFLRQRFRTSMDSNDIKNLPADTMCVASTRNTVIEGNKKHIANIQKTTAATVIDCWAIHAKQPIVYKKKTKSAKVEDTEERDSDEDIQDNDKFAPATEIEIAKQTPSSIKESIDYLNNPNVEEKTNLKSHIELCVGARVILVQNYGASLGLVNGSMGYVVGFMYADSKLQHDLPFWAKRQIFSSCKSARDAAHLSPALPIVLVKFDENSYTYHKSFVPGDERIVPICPITNKVRIDGIDVFRTQLPLNIGKFVTVHKCQSITVKHLIWVLDNIFTMGIAFVALSRVTDFSGLFIVTTPRHQTLTTTDLNKFTKKLNLSK